MWVPMPVHVSPGGLPLPQGARIGYPRSSMALEREEISGAIRSTPNLGAAARKLDTSRRTLQNRMRYYGMPRGKSGRPRHVLSAHGSGMGAFVSVAALVGLGWLASKWWKERSAPTVSGTALHGTDVLGSYY
jgi:regulatory Fis family protein